MLLFWRIRYLDRQDREFKDRDLWLDTSTLDPVTRTAVELCNELRDTGDERAMLKHRRLFMDGRRDRVEIDAHIESGDRFSSFMLTNYFEDENGEELSGKQMAVALTGNPAATLLPAGAKQHDIDYMFADKRPILMDEVAITSDQLQVLAYFARDLRELIGSAFYKDGPGALVSVCNGRPFIETAVTDEEIRSFVTVFRRLYMANEPSNFIKTLRLFNEIVTAYPLGALAGGFSVQYEQDLRAQPNFVPFAGQAGVDFTRKRLIDVFLYTRYAHQPDARRSRQYAECLDSVGGRSGLLFWLFLREMWHCALHMHNAGKIVAEFYDQYCQHHGLSPAVLNSVRVEHPYIGVLETKDALRERVFREKAEDLAYELWDQSGRPAGGAAQFIAEASNQLSIVMSDKSGTTENDSSKRA